MHGAPNRNLQCTRHHRPDSLARVVEPHTLGELRRCVPVHQQRHHTRPSAAFAEAEEDAERVHLLRVFDEGEHACDDAPADFESREPVARANVRQNDLRGYEHDAVRDIEIRCEAGARS